MQALVISFSEISESMPKLPPPEVSQIDFKELKNTVNSLPSKEAFNNLEVRVNLVTWVPAVTVLVAMIGMGITLYVRFDTKIDSINTAINGVSTTVAGQAGKITKLQSAIDVLSSQQSDPTQKLIHDLLATARGADPKIAARATLVAASLTNTLRKENREAPAEFFRASVETLNDISPKANNEVLSAKLALADYRSAIYRPANLAVLFAPGATEGMSIDELKNLPRDGDTTFYKGFAVSRFHGGMPSSMVDFIGGPGTILYNIGTGNAFTPDPRFTRQPLVKNMLILTPIQTLDGIRWENVVFLNAKISYLGGSLSLNNVHFINCTFDVPKQQHQPSDSQKFLDYAVLASPDLSVGM